MKTRLPKALLIAVLAAIVQPVLAEETTPQPDFSTWGTKVTPGVIVGKEQNVTISGNENLPDGLMEGAPVDDATATYGYNKPYLKDGVDTTLTIEKVDATFVNPLYVREGAAEIKDSKILVNCKPDQVMLQVAGNNAEITFTNSSYAHYTSTVFMAVGGPDGKGTMNLVNSHVTATTLMLGHSSASSWMGTFVTNSTAASTAGGDRYSGGEYKHTNRGNGNRFYGEATVNVDADSTLTMKTTLYIAEATLNVNGGEVTTAAEAPYGVVLGKIIDSHSTLNIKDGGQMISAGGFQTGDYFSGVDHSGATILVDGKNDKDEVSTLSTTGVLNLGYGSKNAKDGVVQTSLTVSNGGRVVAGGITLGRDTDANLSNQVQVTVGADSSIEGASLNVLEGAYVANNGELIADTITLGGGELVLGNESTLTLIVDNTAALIFGDTEVLKLATDATKVYVNLVLNSMSAYALRSASTDLILAEGNVELVSAFYSLLDDDNVAVTYVDANGNALNGYGVQKDSDGKLVISSMSDDVVPEPTTTTLSLLALAGLAARRRRAL